MIEESIISIRKQQIPRRERPMSSPNNYCNIKIYL